MSIARKPRGLPTESKRGSDQIPSITVKARAERILCSHYHVGMTWIKHGIMWENGMSNDNVKRTVEKRRCKQGSGVQS